MKIPNQIISLIWHFHCLYGYFRFADVKKVGEKTSKTIKMPNQFISRQKQKRYMTDNDFFSKRNSLVVVFLLQIVQYEHYDVGTKYI